ncbi:MAG: tetratricopeptide repeat-containing serine protease family protein [Cyanobacteriota bacterium]|nr:tetratricopeptide repeat-containing serine protease family protein [Cyanobacteriota bacterium]
MNYSVNYSFLNGYRGFAATVAVAALVVSVPHRAIAKSPTEIARIAGATTVQINSNLTQGGSGVIIARDRNTYTVLTASHVACEKVLPISPCREDITYTVRTHDGSDYPVLSRQNLYGNPDDPDLAIVAFESTQDYSIAQLGDSEHAEIGAMIFVSGFPASQERRGVDRDRQFSPGFVSSRPASRDRGYTMIYNAETWGGMSGGPVFDIEGRVVGIHGTGEDGRLDRISESGDRPVIKTGFNGAIPINTFLDRSDLVNFDRASLTIDNSAPSDDAAERLNNPSESIDYNNRGLLHYGNGLLAQALADFDRAIELDRHSADAYFNRGNVYFSQGDYNKAIADYDRAIDLDATSSLAHNNRAFAYVRQRNYRGAIADWTWAIENGRVDVETYFNRALAYAKLRDWSAVMGDTTEAISFDPAYAKAYNLRGDARLELGDLDGAMADYTQAIESDPSYAIAYNNRATLFAMQGNKAAACQDLETAAQLLLEQGNTSQYEFVDDNLGRLRC